jgi:uncharacterized protein (TIGR03437 family)
VNLTVNPPGPTINTVSDAASYVAGAVAPGEMVVLSGTGLGPDPLVAFLDPGVGVPIDTTLSGVSVDFDTYHAPIIFVSSTQVAVMVPYAVAGQTTTQVKLSYSSQTSNTVTLNVAASVPSVFTINAGTGQAAACNIDESTGVWSINSDTNSVSRGGLIAIYATGQGVTTPVSADGEIATALSTAPYDAAISAMIGGTSATVVYAGYAPGMVVGILEVQLRVPQSIAASKTSALQLAVGSYTSQGGVTIAVK